MRATGPKVLFHIGGGAIDAALLYRGNVANEALFCVAVNADLARQLAGDFREARGLGAVRALDDARCAVVAAFADRGI